MILSSRRLGVAALAAVLAASAAPAYADDLFAPGRDTSTVVVRRDRSRCPRQKLLIGSLLGGGVLASAAGVYFHLRSRDAANEVSTDGAVTTYTWTPERQDTYDAALRDGKIAAVGYAIGGALLVGSVVALILTDPGTEAVTVGPEGVVVPQRTVQVGLVPGGAYAEAGWRW